MRVNRAFIELILMYVVVIGAVVVAASLLDWRQIPADGKPVPKSHIESSSINMDDNE